MEITHVVIICGHAGVVRQGSFRGKESDPRLHSALLVGIHGQGESGKMWYTSK